MKPKLRLEEYEYSDKAAQNAAQRAAQRASEARQINAAVDQRNQQEGRRITRELSEAQQKARQPIEDEATLARSLLQLGAVLGVQPKIERRRQRVR